MFAPAGTPRPVVDRLHAEIVRVFNLPDVQAKMRTLGLDLILGGPDALAKTQQAEIAKWAKVIRDSGAKAE